MATTVDGDVRSLAGLKAACDRLEVFARNTLTFNPNTRRILEYELESWRIEILSVKSALEVEMRKLKKFHRAVAKSARDRQADPDV